MTIKAASVIIDIGGTVVSVVGSDELKQTAEDIKKYTNIGLKVEDKLMKHIDSKYKGVSTRTKNHQFLNFEASKSLQVSLFLFGCLITIHNFGQFDVTPKHVFCMKWSFCLIQLL
eukprot:TRINITY_DN13849_c0_g1_i1.p1 TRINITY_DN13849_c0_g1~~TRINITY_DN13849_c0_g1_i1.p1  ORF type:complete len:115 (+),score=4.72 TRINITY_DN13849_c0_g1_i1:214-558(+)